MERKGEDKFNSSDIVIKVMENFWNREKYIHKFEYILNEFLKPVILTGLVVLVLKI